MWCWHREGPGGQWTRTENPEVDPPEVARLRQGGKQVHPHERCWDTGPWPSVSCLPQILTQNGPQIKWARNYKTFRGKKKENLQDLGLGKEFLDLTQKAWPMKKKTDRLDLIKIKNFCYAAHPVKGMKRQAADWGRVFANHKSYKTSTRLYKGNSTVNTF